MQAEKQEEKLSPLGEAALEYGRKGRFVFPCKPRAKEPLTANGFLDATNSLDQIRAWWTTWPEANIGLPCGMVNNLAVVDVDPRNGGADSGFPDTLVVSTGDGLHRYYRIESELKGTVLRQGIDIKGDGGYVIAPPSVHPNGKTYRKVSGTIQPFPLSLVQPKAPTPLPSVAAGTDEAVPEGGRNTHLISIGGALRAKGCGYGVILSTLQAENYARCRPPLPEQEVARIALSATRYHEGPKLQLVQASTVVKEEVKWIWESWIAAGKINLLEGDPGLGKSTMAAAIVATVTAGRPLPGSAQHTGIGRAIVASAEDNYGDTLVPRLEAAGADLSRVLFLAGLDLSKALHAKALEQEIGSDVKLIVIDPLMAYLGSTNSYSDQSVREVMSRCHNIATRTGVAFLFIRHWNKHEDSSLMYRGGGSIGITGAARSVLAVMADEPGSSLRTLKRVKGNLSRQPEDLTYELVGDPPRILWHGVES